MTRTNFLDQGCDSEIATSVLDALSDSGYSAEEIIPGLILAVGLIAEKCAKPSACLDEAANLLADGPAGDEYWEG